MTQISTIVDAFYTKVADLLPNHKELRNTKRLDQNDTLYLSKGFAISFGPMENSKRYISCKISLKREVTITNTMQVFATDRDVTSRKTVEKSLLEDAYTLIHWVEDDPTINDTLTQCQFVSDNGIEEVFNEQGSFLMIQSLFTFEYFEAV